MGSGAKPRSWGPSGTMKPREPVASALEIHLQGARSLDGIRCVSIGEYLWMEGHYKASCPSQCGIVRRKRQSSMDSRSVSRVLGVPACA